MRGYPTGIPHDVSALFSDLTFKVRDTGYDRYSAYSIMQQIRWHYQIERGQRDFKCNNNWTPILARWFLKKNPAMNGFFELRVCKKDYRNAIGV